jgi:hypothetical protein
MRISTTYVTSFMLRPKNYEIRNVMTVKTKKNKTNYKHKKTNKKLRNRVPLNGAKSVEE